VEVDVCMKDSGCWNSVVYKRQEGGGGLGYRANSGSRHDISAN